MNLLSRLQGLFRKPAPVRRLGKLTPEYDARNFKLAKYVKAVPPPPDTVDYSQVSPLGMMLNDTLGDCVCAAYGHELQQKNQLAGHPYIPSDASVLYAYEAISGYRPRYPWTDRGCNMLRASKYWRKTGLAGHKTTAFATLEASGKPVDATLIKQSIYLFGSANLGFALPVSCQNQTVWDVVPDPGDGSTEPGSWGGHDVPAVAYDASGITVITWGGLTKVTWAFVLKYADEGYAYYCPDWFPANSTLAVSGFDDAALRDDLAAL